MNRWKSVDESHRIYYWINEHKGFYAREYKARQGFDAGETNQLIYNFKKSPSVRNTGQWYYRNQAVLKFAQEASELIRQDAHGVVTAIPSSKAKSDPEYTNRFEDFFSQLLSLRPNLVVNWPVEIAVTVPSAHLNGNRNPDAIKGNYVWKGFQGEMPNSLIVFDDVVTTGSHFRAMHDFLRENGFNGDLYGIFWARSIFPTAFDDFGEEEF